jgi:hypothetical protein
MVDQTVQTQITQVPEYISDRQQQVLNTLYGVSTSRIRGVRIMSLLKQDFYSYHKTYHNN